MTLPQSTDKPTHGPSWSPLVPRFHRACRCSLQPSPTGQALSPHASHLPNFPESPLSSFVSPVPHRSKVLMDPPYSGGEPDLSSCDGAGGSQGSPSLRPQAGTSDGSFLGCISPVAGGDQRAGCAERGCGCCRLSPAGHPHNR